jgi:UDP-N-acetylglucosamine--N-acetylmuramyl-(pentapeptide) pyrophosphoryl-undecaprenol N-acetylglucosamine transferase
MTDAGARTLLFAGGGSGGHISPGLAVAERLTELDPTVRVLFVCSRRAIDHTMLSQAGVGFATVPGSPFSLRPRALLRFAGNFVRSRRAARSIIQGQGVERVVALGGFVAAPAVAAAVRQHTPVTLVNLDAPPGKANRWIARHCRQVLTAVPVPEMPGFAQQVVGMPIRKAAVAAVPADDCRRSLGLDPRRTTLLVTGASQGARTINTLVTALALSGQSAFDGWQVVHLTGVSDERRVRAAYEQAGIPALVKAFEASMGLAWGAADLAVSRAGASSVAEAWANNVPTVFLPYPHHRDRHQHRNAAPMADAGGAIVEEDRLDPDVNLRSAGSKLVALLTDAKRRAAMRQSLRHRPAPDAATTIARLLLGRTSSVKTVAYNSAEVPPGNSHDVLKRPDEMRDAGAEGVPRPRSR